MFSHLRTIVVLLALVVVAPRDASGQFESETAPRFSVPVAAWGSVGLGPGSTRTSREGLVAGVLRANVSVGPWLVTYRSSDVGPFMDPGGGVRDNALLVGMRSSGHRVFGSGALGYARATPYSQRDNSTAGVLAYDATVHANAYVVGLAFSLSGGIGPARASYSAVTLGLEVGWFGW